jgi:hypothetical protein
LRLPVASSGGGPSTKADDAITSTAADMEKGGEGSAGRRMERGRSFLLNRRRAQRHKREQRAAKFLSGKGKHLSIPARCKQRQNPISSYMEVYQRP